VSQPAAESVVWLTQEAYDRLSAELSNLKGPIRSQISQRIAEAREEGDLRENGGYHAAREEQGQQEARIRQLQELLRTAQVGVAPSASDTASPGMVLTIHYDDDPNDVEKLLLGSREEGAHGDLQVISPNSPLGAALLGARVGETREYRLPDGGSMKVTLVSAEPFTG
jgi:transcription elongation factor GreA